MAAHRDFPPRLMSSPLAAHYLSVSESMLRTLKIPRKILGGKRLYDKSELDAYADSLLGEGEEQNSCDAVFGGRV